MVMNRQGEMVLVDEIGRERERYGLQYGARLMVEDGARVKAGQLLAEWDPFAMPIVTEVSGYVKYGDIVDGVTMQESLDEVTGLSRKTIIESKDADSRPRITLKDADGNTVKLPGATRQRSAEARYFLPVGSNIFVNDGDYDRGRRRDREDLARDHEDEGHHRRSAARRRAVRGAQAEGPRGHLRDRRRRALRQGHQGQAQGARGSRGRRSGRVPDPEGQAPLGPRRRSRPRRRGADGRSGEPARHPQGARRARAREVPGRRDPGGLPAPGRAHQRQAHRGDRSPDAASRDASPIRATRTSWSTSRSRSTSSRRRTSA